MPFAFPPVRPPLLLHMVTRYTNATDVIPDDKCNRAIGSAAAMSFSIQGNNTCYVSSKPTKYAALLLRLSPSCYFSSTGMYFHALPTPLSRVVISRTLALRLALQCSTHRTGVPTWWNEINMLDAAATWIKALPSPPKESCFMSSKLRQHLRWKRVQPSLKVA